MNMDFTCQSATLHEAHWSRASGVAGVVNISRVFSATVRTYQAPVFPLWYDQWPLAGQRVGNSLFIGDPCGRSWRMPYMFGINAIVILACPSDMASAELEQMCYNICATNWFGQPAC
mmetsp:Transcript_25310/g.76781  ORF Transcript_25310/g.76781 Transcript_25310/m.76781 type:complete len:117 (+) Transcript_25310:465-815(+)